MYYEKITQVRSRFFKKIIKLITLPRQTKTQVTYNRHEKGDITTDPTHITKVITTLWSRNKKGLA